MSGQRNVADIYPLSPAQQGLLMVVLLSGDPTRFYSDQMVLSLRGRLDAGLWRESWRRVIARHPALRSQFTWERRPRPLQVVRREAELPWQELDWRGVPAAERQGRLDELLRQDHARGFALDQAPLLRATYIHWDGGEARFLWSFHHLILDGWSLALVLAEVRAHYAALLAGAAPALAPAPPFAAYIAWLARQDQAAAEEHWRQALAGLPEEAPLPFEIEPGATREPDPASDLPREPHLANDPVIDRPAAGAASQASAAAASPRTADDAGSWATVTEVAILPADVSRGLTALARRHRLTANTLFQGIWALLLARAAGRDEVVFGSVVSGRPAELPGVEEMVGLFINTLPVRARIEPPQELAAWLAALQERQAEHRRFEHTALEQIHAWAGLPRERQLFRSLLVFQNFPGDPPGAAPEAGEDGAGRLAVSVAYAREATHYPLVLYVKPLGDEITLGISCHRERFEAGAPRRLLALARNLLAAAVSRAGARLDELSLLDDAERREVLAAGRGAASSGPRAGRDDVPAAVLHRFTAQAAARPDAVAVDDDTAGLLSYAALAARSDRLAATLRRRGVRTDDLVGVCLERSLDLVASLLAVWKAGAGYLPLDPAYPPERLAFMTADSGARLVMTTAAIAERSFRGREPAAGGQRQPPAGEPPASATPGILCLDGGEREARGTAPQALGADGDAGREHGSEAAAASDTGDPLGAGAGSAGDLPGAEEASATAARRPAAASAIAPTAAASAIAPTAASGPAHPAAAAYVIYTSGSTGTPKGVVVSHGALASFVTDGAAPLGVGPGDRVLQFASVSFDASAEEIYPCLAGGATLVLRGAAMAGTFQGFLADAERRQVTVLDLPTAWWHELSADLDRHGLPLPAAVRLTIIGGEEARGPAVAAWRARAGARSRLLNTYGPTEATVVATQHELTPPPRPDREGTGGRVPIGRPAANACAHVLGLDLEPLPAGLDGELWLGGAGLARGYLGRPELTADRFRPDPFATAESGGAGARLYRTGDLGRQLPGGSLVFRGRADGQVKVRGFRIEPGEIEAALRALPGVRDAAVVLSGGDAATRRLVAFVVPRTPAEVSPAVLRAGLAARLPEHMIPAAFATLEALPLTASGKVDRRALSRLPPPEAPAAERPARRAPRTPVEELVAGIWSELFQVESVGLDDNFFALGGHSLLVAQVLSRLRQAVGVEVPLVELFHRPTVAELAALIERPGEAAPAAAQLPQLPPIVRVPRDGRPLPLSYAQERVWVLDQLQAGGNLAYNFQVTIRLRGALGVAVLERTLGEVVRRHEVLRTSFPLVDGRPAQVVHPVTPFRLPMVDLAALPAALRPALAERLVEELIGIPFVLERGPLIRWRLLRLAADDHLLVQVEHHFVHDGWSLGVLLREIKALYEAFSRGAASPLPEPPVQYADFAAWQREWMEGPVMERLLAFWKGKLAGAPRPLELATDRPRPAKGSFRGEVQLLDIDADLYAALRRFARREGFTLYMTMLAGFLALLHRYTGEEDVLIGTANANRRAREIEGMLGMVVNTLPLRADLAGAPSFRTLLGRARGLALETWAHQDTPFERLVQELRVERRPGRNPLFQILFNFHDAPVPDVRIGGLDTHARVRSNHTAKMDMNVIVVPRAEQRIGQPVADQDRRALLHWEHNTDLFDPATVKRMAAHLQTLLAGALAEPGLALAELPLLAAAERAQVLQDWNDTAGDYPGAASIPALVAGWAARTPAAPAVVCGDGPGSVLSYAVVDAWAGSLADELSALGAGPGTRVALAAERSPVLVPAILGILKTGAAYVPLDPAYPPARLAWMLADSGAGLLAVQEHLRERLPAPAGMPVLGLPGGAFSGAWHAESDAAPAAPAARGEGPAGDDVAYVMYTSGSTGEPKGVPVTHRNVIRLVHNSGYARFGPQEVFLHAAPLSFDASTFELWGALLHGARVVLHPPAAPSPESLGEVIGRHRVTTAWLTAALFHQMAESNLDGLAPLRQLLAGGDTVSPAHARRVLAAHPELTLIDGYGPTETTTFAACHRLTAAGDGGQGTAPSPGCSLTHGHSPATPAVSGAPLPIGRPIGNTRTHVVDAALRPLPIGVPGELLIGGDGVALGYLGRPALTAARFIPDPFAGAAGGGAAGGRLYRTGDRVRWLPGGALDFLGRFDRQVKIRGYRVEPGEAEAVLATHPAVREAAVVAQPEPGGAGGLRLAAFVAADEDPGLPAALRRHLAAHLPPHLVPSVWTVLPELPRTAAGKVDRRALARDTAHAAGGPAHGERVAPRTPEEQVVAALWQQVLGRDALSVHDDFFLLGGHSLAATRVLSRLRQEHGADLTLADLFEHTVLADLAAAVAIARGAGRPESAATTGGSGPAAGSGHAGSSGPAGRSATAGSSEPAAAGAPAAALATTEPSGAAAGTSTPKAALGAAFDLAEALNDAETKDLAQLSDAETKDLAQLSDAETKELAQLSDAEMEELAQLSDGELDALLAELAGETSA